MIHNKEYIQIHNIMMMTVLEIALIMGLVNRDVNTILKEVVVMEEEVKVL